MLTISAFILAAGSVVTAVWWACRNEELPERRPELQAPSAG